MLAATALLLFIILGAHRASPGSLKNVTFSITFLRRRLGAPLGAIRDALGSVSGRFWVPLGVLLGAFGQLFDEPFFEAFSGGV